MLAASFKDLTVMKQISLLATLFFVTYFVFGQNDGPKEITPQVLQKLKADVEKQIPSFRQKLSKQELTADQIEFSLDTFRIEQLVSKRMDIDYSTVGMNITVDEMTSSYDRLTPLLVMPGYKANAKNTNNGVSFRYSGCF
jgi:hypothetical protein